MHDMVAVECAALVRVCIYEYMSCSTLARNEGFFEMFRLTVGQLTVVCICTLYCTGAYLVPPNAQVGAWWLEHWTLSRENLGSNSLAAISKLDIASVHSAV